MMAVCVTAFGSSVVRLTLQDIANHSGQILTGKVQSTESYWTEEYGSRTIETKVTLEQVAYFKGQRRSSTQFDFTVPGGTVGDMTMRIAGAPEFRQGEEWILFLLPEWKSFPTVGLYQGAYQIVDGVVKDGNGVSVANIDKEGFVVSSLGSPKLQGRAQGANVHVHDSSKAISRQQFLEQIIAIAKKSKPIKLKHDAGKRIAADYTAVPLKEKQ